jgi:hypothetical protein
MLLVLGWVGLGVGLQLLLMLLLLLGPVGLGVGLQLLLMLMLLGVGL